MVRAINTTTRQVPESIVDARMSDSSDDIFFASSRRIFVNHSLSRFAIKTHVSRHRVTSAGNTTATVRNTFSNHHLVTTIRYFEEREVAGTGHFYRYVESFAYPTFACVCVMAVSIRF